LKVNNPHDSHHVDGRVNVIAVVSCTAPVSSIAGAISLRRDGISVATKGASSTGLATLRLQTAAVCVNGVYHAIAAASIAYPPGSIPQSSFLQASSRTLPVNCS
jgi:hypothetical protein